MIGVPPFLAPSQPLQYPFAIVSNERIDSFARRIGLNAKKFKQQMQSKQVAKRVAADRQEGMNAGIKGTPAIFINGSQFMGEMSKEGLSKAIDIALEE